MKHCRRRHPPRGEGRPLRARLLAQRLRACIRLLLSSFPEKESSGNRPEGRRPRLLSGAMWAIMIMFGRPGPQCARTTRAVRGWSRGLPGYHAVLAMHAFALEECGDYERRLRRCRRSKRSRSTAARITRSRMSSRCRDAPPKASAGSAPARHNGAAWCQGTHLWWHHHALPPAAWPSRPSARRARPANRRARRPPP